jgi:hypothetical protein
LKVENRNTERLVELGPMIRPRNDIIMKKDISGQ